MGGVGSTQRHGASGSKSDANAHQAAADVKMDEGAEGSDAVGEANLGSLRVKDPEAWKGSPAQRPRSALKHGSSITADEGLVERTPSGRKVHRKVSFQVQGLAPPMEVQEAEAEAAAAAAAAAGEGGAADEHAHAHKRAKGVQAVSMKFLVDRFYGKVLQLEPLKPFFDGVDMYKLKYQQEALMLLVFGGHELLEDELPGLSADLRLIHLHLIFEGLNLTHWRLFADTFAETLDELPQIPEEVKARAKAYMESTQRYFRPIEPEEWPPKVVYKGWTKRSCPFHCAASRPADAAAEASHEAAAAPAEANVKAPAAAAAADDDFTLPGYDHAAAGTAPAVAAAAVPVAADGAAGEAAATPEGSAAGEAPAS